MAKAKKKVPRGTSPVDFLAKLGEAFLVERTKQDMQYNQLEELSGVSTVTLSKIEKGKLENTSVQTLFSIAEALGLDIVEIIKQ